MIEHKTDQEKLDKVIERLWGEIHKIESAKRRIAVYGTTQFPYIDDGALYDAVNLLIAQKPHVLNPQELEEREVFWLELRKADKVEAAIHYGKNADCAVHFLETKIRYPIYELKECDYGFDWRCWDRKPTDEQRRETLWGDALHERSPR